MKYKNYFLMFLLILFIIPINVYAYSDKLILGGDNIGIMVNTKGILVIGMYEIDGNYASKYSDIKEGDYIVKVNDSEVTNISDYTREINNDLDKEEIDIEYVRKNTRYKDKLKLFNQNGEYKTGLYVKDNVKGIGTLTYIDPNNKSFGALGHEISNSNDLLQIDNGLIYYSYITGINKSSNGNPGEKKSDSNEEDIYGNITRNSNKGIFGKYTKDISEDKLYEVANKDEVNIGKASIYTVVDGNDVGSYEIEIEKINMKDNTKNIVFKITDEKLLDETGGIVQGMSGSPIVQNNKIIGAVTHVIVDDCKKGYGIFITNMLEEAEK